jgi:hypothetical protein
MSLKPNPKEINIILNILKGAQFEFLPRAPFYIDTPLAGREPPFREDLSTEAEESPQLKAVTRVRLVKSQQAEKGLGGAVVICELWRLAVAP